MHHFNCTRVKVLTNFDRHSLLFQKCSVHEFNAARITPQQRHAHRSNDSSNDIANETILSPYSRQFKNTLVKKIESEALFPFNIFFKGKFHRHKVGKDAVNQL
jgi:hypothetical protein